VARRKTLVITQYYRPVPNFVSGDVADRMKAHGPVTVVTAHPSYPYGKFYSGSRWWRPERTVEDGVVVWRLPMIPDQSNSKLRRLVSYFSFLLLATAIAPLVGGRPSVVWVYQTPFTTAIAAIWFKIAYRSRLVYTCADLWPESFSAAGVVTNGPLLRALAAYRRWSNRWADAIICSTKRMKDVFAAEGAAVHRLRYVPVWIEGTDRYLPQADESDRVIVYAGNLGPAQELETVVRAAAELHAHGVDIAFHLYGTGSSEGALRRLAHNLGAKNVTFMGRVTPEAAFQASSRAVAQVVSLRRSSLFRMTIPSKLFFCFAAASPILYGLEGESADIAAASGGGVAFNPESVDSLVTAVYSLLGKSTEERERMRRSLRRFFENDYSPDKLLREYEIVLLGAANGLAASEVVGLGSGDEVPEFGVSARDVPFPGR
jgi:colanic acid biosynthesis glycosyl transferase WcaI